MNRSFNILFLSTGNAARSILAESILRHRGGARFNARSAGFKPEPEVHPHTLKILENAGFPTDGLHAKGWGDFVMASPVLKIDAVITLSAAAQDNAPAIYGNPLRVHWPVDDPLSTTKVDMMEWKYRKVFATLESRIAMLMQSRLSYNQDEMLMCFKDIATLV